MGKKTRTNWQRVPSPITMKREGGETKLLSKIRNYRMQRKSRKRNRLLAQVKSVNLLTDQDFYYHNANFNQIILGQVRHPKKKRPAYYQPNVVLNSSLVLAPSSSAKCYQLYQADIGEADFEDSFFANASNYLVEGLSRYLESLYEQQISEDLLLQELIAFFEIKNNCNVKSTDILEKLKEVTGYSSIALEVLKESTLEDVFGFLDARIITQLAEGTLKRDETFSSRIKLLFDSL